MAPAISVIIPEYRNDEALERCLEALALQDLPQSLWEVIVVRNSLDSQIISHPKILNFTCVREPKPGAYVARNLGIRMARGEVLAFTDSDCVPDRMWLSSAYHAAFDRKPTRFTGPIELFSETSTPSLASDFQATFAFDSHRDLRNRSHIATANLVCARAIFDDVGLFNEELFSGGDVDWNTRANAAGYESCYIQAMRVRHPTRSTIRELLGQRLRYAGAYRERESALALILRKLVEPRGVFRKIVARRELPAKRKLLLLLLYTALGLAELMFSVSYALLPKLRRRRV